MTQQILATLLLGLIGGIIPGPVLAATFAAILHGGFRKSIRIILWATLTEASVALFTLTLLSSLGLSRSFFYGASFLGAALLIWIARQLWKAAALDAGHTLHFSGWQIAGMILTNTALWTFWVTVCVPKAILMVDQIPGGQYLFIVLYEVAWVTTTATIALIFSSFRAILSHSRLIAVVFKTFALIFVLFALQIFSAALIFFSHGSLRRLID